MAGLPLSRRVRYTPVLVLVVGAILSGCVDEPAPQPVALLPVPPPGYFESLRALPGLDWVMTGCSEGGGVSVYPSNVYGNPLPDPFIPADISAEVGAALIASQPSIGGVMTGSRAGNWHMVVTCADGVMETNGGGPERATSYGWVASKVIPPPWDESGIKDHYLLADLSLESVALTIILRDLAGVHTTAASQIVYDKGDDAVHHALLDDPEAGAYEMLFGATAGMDAPPLTTRYWLLAPVGDHAHEHNPRGHAQAGQYRPVGFDVVDTESKAHFVSPDSSSTFTHTGTTHHGPQGAAVGNVVGVAYADFERTIRLAAMPEVTLDRTWFH